MNLKLSAAESAPSATDLLGFIPGPIGAFLASLLLLLPIITEVKGWTKGPLNKRVVKAAEKAEEEKAERAERWEDRDRRYEELEEAFATLKGEVARLLRQVGHMNRVGDEQNRLLVDHSNWDREAQAEINRRGGNLRPPPQLYVYFGDDGSGTVNS